MLTQRHFVNRPRAKQLISFEGLCYPNKITPTDIDFAIEYHGQKCVLGEVKHEGTDLPFGQRLLLERYTNNFEKAGKSSLAFVSKHSVNNPDDDVMIAETYVDEFYYNSEWHKFGKEVTVKELMDAFLLKPYLFELDYVLCV